MKISVHKCDQIGPDKKRISYTTILEPGECPVLFDTRVLHSLVEVVLLKHFRISWYAPVWRSFARVFRDIKYPQEVDNENYNIHVWETWD